MGTTPTPEPQDTDRIPSPQCEVTSPVGDFPYYSRCFYTARYRVTRCDESVYDTNVGLLCKKHNLALLDSGLHVSTQLLRDP